MKSESPTVYILDDECSIRVAMARLLRAGGFLPVMMNDMDELLKLESFPKRACVIADVRMPGASGLTLPALLANRGLNIPVIFVSAQDTEETRAEARRVGAAHFFHKPVDDLALFDAISWALEPGDGNFDNANHNVH